MVLERRDVYETPYSPAMQPEAPAVYAETFHDTEALNYARALAKGEVHRESDYLPFVPFHPFAVH